MPRSSRSKSHKQSKHGSKEYSDFEENDGKEDVVSVRVSKDSSVSGEKRKLSHANGNVLEEQTTSLKRRKEKSDRWNGDGVEDVNVDGKKLKSKDELKGVGESKSRSSRRHDVDNAFVVVAEKDGSKNGNGDRGEKRSEKESGRKEGNQFKENKEFEDQPSKRGRGTNEWPIEEELRNIELEKELEKRMLSTKRGRVKDIKHKDEKHKDKHREDDERVSKSRDVKYIEKDNKHRDEKYREDDNRDSRHKDDKHRDDGDRKGRHRDEKYRNRDDKHRQDDDRDHSHKNSRSRDDSSREKGVRDSKHRDSKDDKKTNNRGGSPVYDDRVARNKNDKDRKRDNDKDEANDYRARSIKDQRSESEKRSTNNANLDPISERGRPSSRDDVDIMANHSHRKSSPSGKSYPARDHYRVSKQEETKYRDEKARHNINADFTSAPKQSVNISSRSPDKTTRNNDNYTNDDKGSRKLAMEALPDNDLLQVESDNLPVSSPYTRTGHFSGNYKSLLPLQQPLGFGSCEDDRGKSNNRYPRLGDPSIGRAQSNWNNAPTWPSPLSNGGYMNIPFPHVPPPMFHPVMQQFASPIFGRPPLNVNHAGMPYSGHRNPVTWRNPAEESIPPPLWEPNNAVFDWDHGRAQLNNQMWESSDFWMQGLETGVNSDGQSAKKDDPSSNGANGLIDEIRLFENEQHQLDIVLADTTNDTPEAMEVVAEEDDTLISRVYLSKLDISEDLTHPELYNQFTSMLDLDQAGGSDEFDCRILFLEDGIEADIRNGASLFAAIDDSVFKKAMSLYKKQTVKFTLTTIPASNQLENSSDKGLVLEANNEINEPPIPKLESNPVIDDEQISTPNKADLRVVKQEEESFAPSVKDNGKQSNGGSLLVLTTTEAVMPELIEFGSVKLSRIHHRSH